MDVSIIDTLELAKLMRNYVFPRVFPMETEEARKIIVDLATLPGIGLCLNF